MPKRQSAGHSVVQVQICLYFTTPFPNIQRKNMHFSSYIQPSRDLAAVFHPVSLAFTVYIPQAEDPPAITEESSAC